MQLTGLLSQLSYTNQDHLQRGCTAPSEVKPPALIINQENALQTCEQANLMETFSQLRVTLSQMALAYVKLTSN